MRVDDKQTVMIATAIGCVVMELSGRDETVTRESIVEMLEFYRRITRNEAGKDIYRDAAEVVRTGKSGS